MSDPLTWLGKKMDSFPQNIWIFLRTCYFLFNEENLAMGQNLGLGFGHQYARLIVFLLFAVAFCLYLFSDIVLLWRFSHTCPGSNQRKILSSFGFFTFQITILWRQKWHHCYAMFRWCMVLKLLTLPPDLHCKIDLLKSKINISVASSTPLQCTGDES